MAAIKEDTELDSNSIDDNSEREGKATDTHVEEWKAQIHASKRGL